MLLSILVFFSVALGVAGIGFWLIPTRAEERLLTAAGPETTRAWSETAVKVVGPLANLSAPAGDWMDSPLRIRFLHAGLRRSDMRLLYFGSKTLLPIVFGAVAFGTAVTAGAADGLELLTIALGAALVGIYLPNVLLSMRIRRRQREIFENFPDAADLMLVCVEAGLGLDAAMTRVASEMWRKSPATAEELHLANLELRAGNSRESALRNLALRTGVEQIMRFATMICQADRFGTSIGDSLRVFSEDLRHTRQIQAEERAAKIPVKMLIPLVLCIFPSVIAVVLGPAMIRIMRTLIPMLGGGH